MVGRPFDLVDATGLDVSSVGGDWPVRSLRQLRAEEIVASGLLGRRRPFSGAESDAALATWAQLRRENAPVRVVRDGRLEHQPERWLPAFGKKPMRHKDLDHRPGADIQDDGLVSAPLTHFDAVLTELAAEKPELSMRTA